MNAAGRGTEPTGLRVNLRALRSISQNSAPAQPELPSFSTRHLRHRLSPFAVTLSPKRLAAVIAPVIMGGFFWVTVPAMASSLTDTSSSPAIVVVTPAAGTSDTSVTQGQPPAQVAPAVAPAAAPAAAPAGVAPAAAPATHVVGRVGKLGAPITGAADGFLRIALVGLCLAFSGFALLTAPKRNPHAALG